jgi:hypothetical protein
MLDWGGFLKLKRHERLHMCGLIVAVDDYLNGTGDGQAHQAIKKRCDAWRLIWLLYIHFRGPWCKP